MGTRAFLSVGSSLIAEWKEGYDRQVLSVFTEADRRDEAVADEEWSDDTRERHQYVVPAAHARERLELMGITRESTRAAFDRGLHDLLRFETDVESPAVAAALRALTLERWLKLFESFGQSLNDPQDFERFQDQHPEWTWLLEHTYAAGFPSLDPRHALRAVLEYTPEREEVGFDFGQLVQDGFVSANDQLVNSARADQPDAHPLVDRLILLTEGSTDAQILRETLRVRRPYLSDYVTFPDFAGSNAEGGASELSRTVRSFVSAGIRNRVVALFDNDTAGAEALQTLQGVALPVNIQAICLPPLPLASNYPTLGPQGRASLDVNGLACSLELYLGRDVLDDGNGSLVPIQWRGYNQKLGRYQGEVLDKRGLRERYFDRLGHASRHPEAFRAHDWSGMDLVWEAIIYAFSNQARSDNAK